MIKSTIKQTLTAMALAAASVGSANAFVIVGGDFKMTVDLYDSATASYTSTCNSVASCDAAVAPGGQAAGSIGSVNTSADTMGIFSISSITRVSDNIQWFTRGVDGYLTGIFGNLQDSSVSLFGPFVATTSVGGTFAVYKNAFDYNTSLGPNVGVNKDLNAGLYPGISGGQLVLQGVFGSGTLLGDTTTTFSSVFNGAGISGNSSAYLDIIGGDWAYHFDTDSQVGLNGEIRDLKATFTFSPTSDATSKGWTVASTADIGGSTVPEPGALALIALGLLGAGAATRRKA
ncbi:PEP-CTERM sorting domain-containing protein [Aquabacterium sp. G14]|uniref:PEP-CTERM sorting domain-containing protein n=1 Tax=Aquabacterium sp. G14 TaxID=3130164 RepID=UPI0030ABC5B6